MVSCGMQVIKYLLFFFNFVFFIAGVALIVIGALVQTKFSSYFAFFGDSMNAAAILLIVIGCVMFVIGFFGCCGACKESACMVQTFAGLLILVLVLEVAAAITGFVLKDKVNDLIDGQLKKTITHYDPSNMQDGVTAAWNLAQQDMKCCGANNYTDWKSNADLSKTGSVPWSCCDVKADPTSTCGNGQARHPTKIYVDGCITKMEDWASHNIIIIGAVAAAFAFIQVFGIIIACCLAKAISKEYDVV